MTLRYIFISWDTSLNGVFKDVKGSCIPESAGKVAGDAISDADEPTTNADTEYIRYVKSK